MVNDKTFDHRPISELMAIVKNDFRKLDNEGLIDEGTLIKTILYCNEKLGLTIRELREVAIPVLENRAELPEDFDKLFYVCAIGPTNTMVHTQRNPWDNNFDQDVIYEAHLDQQSLGCVENYRVIINRETTQTVHNYGSWVQLDVSKGSEKYCHIDCPNKRKPGKYTVTIEDDHLDVPFRSGELYMMYLGMMKDAEGNLTFPFHPLITPYYEWSIKEKVLQDALMNSDMPNIGELLQYASRQKSGAWLDAFNFTTDSGYGKYVDGQRKRELLWYNKYFKYFQ